ncbi:MAG: metabolite traffic protein EboE [Phycisphaerales bacterium]|nr:metabolite traffic protein EboE [Phycisphaerales bacterium]
MTAPGPPEPQFTPRAPVIAYCANVARASTIAEARRGIVEELAQAREAAGLAEIGVGLWLPDGVAREIVPDPDAPLRDDSRRLLGEWRSVLAERNVFVIGFNGFPFGAFHADTVRHDVYMPNWTTRERCDYTRRLALMLTELAPDGAKASSVTTVPLGWREHLTEADRRACGQRLAELTDWLARLEMESGLRVRVDIEPEPGCALQRASDVVAFFERHLDAVGDAGLNRRHIRICHDICHAAALFEPQEATISAYLTAGIDIGRVQVSSIPRGVVDAEASSGAIRAALAEIVERRYLHQTAVRAADGQTWSFDDLPDALRAPDADCAIEWRTHFHIPIHLDGFGALRTTRDDIVECLNVLRAREVGAPLEIETYAWQVAPAAVRASSLAESMSAEIGWLRDQVRRVWR